MGASSGNLLRMIGDLEGIFFVPHYQRGYRWTQKNVTDFLKDLEDFVDEHKNDKKKYFLQPIVVCKLTGDNSTPKWELIDGQQRLTTICLLDAVLRNRNKAQSVPKFNIEYDRKGSGDFLVDIAKGNNNNRYCENIDSYHMWKAYGAIKSFVDNKKLNWDCGLVAKRIVVLWHDITPDGNNDEGQGLSSTGHFTRLNMGRIPLTVSELTRASLLNALRNVSNGVDVTRQQVVIGKSWDEIEFELRDPDFWAFCGGDDNATYQATRIDYLLDLHTQKPENTYNWLHSFDEISNQLVKTPAKEVWEEITQKYAYLRHWYDDANYMHWIGYLCNLTHLCKAGEKPREILRVLLEEAACLPKTQFRDKVFERIRKSFDKDKQEKPNLDELCYDDRNPVLRVLFLCNVEYSRRRGMRFPFGRFRKSKWELEHIEARNVREITNHDDRLVWVYDHREAMKNWKAEMFPDVKEDKFIDSMINLMNMFKDFEVECEKAGNPEESEKFKAIQGMYDSLTDNLFGTEKDNLSNLALLGKENNISLSNYLFAAKRKKIIGMIDAGEYIPIATEAVFLRYFSEENMGLPYWSTQDRESYLKRLQDILFSQAKDGIPAFWSKDASGGDQCKNG